MRVFYNFNNVLQNKSFFFFLNSYFLIHLSFFLVLFSYFSCEETTKPETVSFSGTVTLEGKQDRSDVKVMLFRPITIDTALTNLNDRYPGIGIEINQRTEFYWREHNPSYQTTTNSAGAWKIEDVVPGQYHIVAQADSFGWKVVYNAGAGNNDIILNKALQWEGIYNQSVTIPSGSFIEIIGDATFSNGTQVVIEPGVIVEFQNNSTLELNGSINFNGNKSNEIFLVAADTNNTSAIEISQCDNVNINFICLFYIKGGLYITSTDSAKISNSRLKKCSKPIELFDMVNTDISNNCIANCDIGVKVVHVDGVISKNIYYDIETYGIELHLFDFIIKNNIIRNCTSSGLKISQAFGNVPDYSNFSIVENDFIENRWHIEIGKKAIGFANDNNFMNEDEYLVYTWERAVYDTLNFQNNFWSYSSVFDISQKIEDRLDRLNATVYFGPVIDFQNYYYSYISWIN